MPEIMPPTSEAVTEGLLMQIPDDEDEMEEMEDEELEEELIIEDFTIDGICGVY